MPVDTPMPTSDSESGLSRRGLIRNAAAAGATGLAAGVLVNAMAGSAQAHEPSPGQGPEQGAATTVADASAPLIVHVRDARTGEIDIFHGEEHRSVQDRKLAAALLRAAD
ncbi:MULTISPECIES: hypothetical protein [Streptacidiphilus]|uniref:Uncharacterized protein n=1 Tax=Streptacidiphilus cavernicola TaxID=3342716 RepID=A0ABV6UKG0_9ACTN|nr:hypothetical protein [Streptacidiphilus jeojiense]